MKQILNMVLAAAQFLLLVACGTAERDAAEAGASAAVIVRGDNDSIQSMEDLNGKHTATTQVEIPTRKGEESAALLAAINEALAGMAEDGTLTELSVKYFGTDISKDQ